MATYYILPLEVKHLKERDQWRKWCECVWFVETRGLSVRSADFEVVEVLEDGRKFHTITSEVVAEVAASQRQTKEG